MKPLARRAVLAHGNHQYLYIIGMSNAVQFLIFTSFVCLLLLLHVLIVILTRVFNSLLFVDSQVVFLQEKILMKKPALTILFCFLCLYIYTK